MLAIVLFWGVLVCKTRYREGAAFPPFDLTSSNRSASWIRDFLHDGHKFLDPGLQS